MTDSNDRLPIRTVWRTLEPVNVKQKQHSCCSNIKRVTNQAKTRCILLLSAITNLILSQGNSDLLPRPDMQSEAAYMADEITEQVVKLLSTHSLSQCSVKHLMDVSSQACVCLFTGLLYP